MKHLRSMGPAATALMLLAGCSDPSWGPSWNMSSRPAAPGDSVTIQRVMGQDPDVPPLTTETGRWASRESPRATLANPEQAMQGVPSYEPVRRPEVDRSLPPPRRGSSGPADLPGVEPIPVAPPARAPRVTPNQNPPRVEGTVVPIPGQSPGVVTGGTPYYQTYQQPNTAGGGVIIPQGNGMGTVIGPDGRVMTVPMPR